MHTRNSPDGRTIKPSKFALQANNMHSPQRSFIQEPSIIVIPPNSPKTVRPKEQHNGFQMDRPATRKDLKRTMELNNSNVSIVNQFLNSHTDIFSERQPTESPDSQERISQRQDRRDLQLAYFKQELDRCRQQAVIDRANSQNMQEALRWSEQTRLKDNMNHKKQKELLLQRVTNLEKQLQSLQIELTQKSKVSTSSISAKQSIANNLLLQQKQILQKQLTTMLKKDVDLQNQIETMKKLINERKPNRQLTFELGVLANLNENLMKQNDQLKNIQQQLELRIRELEREHSTIKLQSTDRNLQNQRKMVQLETEVRTLERALEEKTFQLQMENHKTKSVADIEKQAAIQRLQQQIIILVAQREQSRKESQKIQQQFAVLNLQYEKKQLESREQLEWKSGYDNLQRQIQEITLQRDNLQQKAIKACSELEQARLSTSIKQRELNQLKQQIMQVEKDKMLTQGEFLSMRHEIDQMRIHMSGQIEQLQRQNRIMTESNRELRVKMESQVNLTSKVRQLQRKILQQQNQKIEYIQQNRKQLDNVKRQSQHKRRELERELEDAKHETSSISRQLDSARSELSNNHRAFQKQIEDAEKQRKIQQQSLILEREQLKRQLQEFEQQALRSRNTLQRTKQQILQTHNKIHELQQENSKLVSKIQSYEYRLNHEHEIKRELEETKKQMEKYVQNINQNHIQSEKYASNIRRLGQLEQLQKVFQLKQQKMQQLVRSNVSRLAHFQAEYTAPMATQADRRLNIINQIIQLVQSLTSELKQKQRIGREIQAELHKKIERQDRLQIQLKQLGYEKTHLLNEMEGMLSKMKQVEGNAQILASMARSSEAEGKRLKSLNKSLKTKLEKEFADRQWLQNQLKGTTEEKKNEFSRAKQERSTLFQQMRQTVEVRRH